MNLSHKDDSCTWPRHFARTLYRLRDSLPHWMGRKPHTGSLPSTSKRIRDWQGIRITQPVDFGHNAYNERLRVYLHVLRTGASPGYCIRYWSQVHTANIGY